MNKKNQPQLEFSRPLLVARVPRMGSHEVFVADPAECEGVAKRITVPTIHSLKAHLIATPWRGGGLKVTGGFEVDMEQVSIVSLEPFRQTYKFDVERYFLPPKIAIDGIEEDADIIEDGEIDLGEIVTETLALEIDPYPKKAGEAYDGPSDEEEPGVEAEPSPFAKLTNFGKFPTKL